MTKRQIHFSFFGLLGCLTVGHTWSAQAKPPSVITQPCQPKGAQEALGVDGKSLPPCREPKGTKLPNNDNIDKKLLLTENDAWMRTNPLIMTFQSDVTTPNSKQMGVISELMLWQEYQKKEGAYAQPNEPVALKRWVWVFKTSTGGVTYDNLGNFHNVIDIDVVDARTGTVLVKYKVGENEKNQKAIIPR